MTLDLLTYADLETLRERRNAASTGKKHPSKPAPSSAHQQQQQQQQSPHSKRYLILTYSVEFDRCGQTIVCIKGERGEGESEREERE